MSYVINLTNGGIFATIADGTINTNTGITIIGRNYPNYGDAQNENFVKLLENFADTVPPTQSSLALTPLTGTAWYDSANKRLRVFDGVNWSNASERFVANSAPLATTNTLKVGDQWFDSVNNQLNSWNGTAWTLIGPNYSSGQGITGPIATTIFDTNLVSHNVLYHYASGNLVSITSSDLTFTPMTPVTGITTIQPGVNLVSGTTLNGTAGNTLRVGGVDAAYIPRTDVNSAFSQDVSVAGTLSLSSANLYYSSQALTIRNTAVNGNINFAVNTPIGTVTALNVNGANGLVSVYSNPTANAHVANKNYVDTQISTVVGNVQGIVNTFYANIQQLQQDYLANANIINTAIADTNANVAFMQYEIVSNVTAINNAMSQGFANTTAATTSLQTQIDSIDTYLENTVPALAPVYGPVLQGNPTVPVVPAITNYALSRNLLSYIVVLDRPVTVNVGDYIQEVNPTTYAVMSNLRVANSVVNSTTVGVTLVGGVVAANTYPTMTRNNQFGAMNDAHISSYTRNVAAPQLWYSGLGDTSMSAASTTYVDLTANLIYADYTSKFAGEVVSRNVAITNAVAGLANIASPVFTGTPKAPTQGQSDNSTNIATTAYVTTAIAAQKFNYTVANTAPVGGNPGDFWFQIG